MIDFTSMHGEVHELLAIIHNVKDEQQKQSMIKIAIKLNNKLEKHEEGLNELMESIEGLKGEI